MADPVSTAPIDANVFAVDMPHDIAGFDGASQQDALAILSAQFPWLAGGGVRRQDATLDDSGFPDAVRSPEMHAETLEADAPQDAAQDAARYGAAIEFTRFLKQYPNNIIVPFPTRSVIVSTDNTVSVDIQVPLGAMLVNLRCSKNKDFIVNRSGRADPGTLLTGNDQNSASILNPDTLGAGWLDCRGVTQFAVIGAQAGAILICATFIMQV